MHDTGYIVGFSFTAMLVRRVLVRASRRCTTAVGAPAAAADGRGKDSLNRVLTQVSTATRALENVALSLLDEHMHHCVVDAARAGGHEAEMKLAEASAIIARLVRS